MGMNEQEWTGMNIRREWTGMDRNGHDRTGLDRNGQKKTRMDRNPTCGCYSLRNIRKM